MEFLYEDVYQELTNIKPDTNCIKENCLTVMDTASYVAECAENEFYNLFKTVGVNEYAYFKKHGTTLIYEADDAAKAGFFTNVKKFFINLWEKIKAAFEVILAKIAEKRKAKLALKKERIVKGYEILLKTENVDLGEGYLYKKDLIKATQAKLYQSIGASTKYYESIKSADDYRKDDIYEGIIKVLAPAGVTYTKDLQLSEAVKEFFKKVRGEKVQLGAVALKEMHDDIVGDFTESITGVKKAYNELKKAFSKVIAQLSKGKVDEAMKPVIAAAKDTLTGYNTISTAINSVLVGYIVQVSNMSAKCYQSWARNTNRNNKDVEDAEKKLENENESVLFSFL